jgi:hypothetical protein
MNTVTYTEEEQFQLAKVIIVCYPKTGSTWLQAMIAQYLEVRHGIMLKSFKQMFMRSLQVSGVDPILRTHDDGPHVKTVSELEQDKLRYREKKVILLIRDPRDIVVSYFFWVTRGREVQWSWEPFKGAVDEFVHSRIGGLRTIIAFYNIWARNKHVPREFMLVRYEDVCTAVFAQMCRVLAFMGETTPSLPHLEKAIELGKFEHMRRLEEANAPGLGRPAHISIGDYEGYKMRRGIVGGYADYLHPETIEEMDHIINSELADEFSFYKVANHAGGLYGT